MLERVHPHVREIVIQQNEARKEWVKNDTPENLDRMIAEEWQEAEEALDYSYLGASAFLLASELGDVFYLFIKRVEYDEPITEEVATIIQNASRLAEDAEIDLTTAVLMKCLRNDQKHTHMMANNGYSHEQARSFNRELWSHIGDAHWSHAYLALSDKLVEMTDGTIEAIPRNGQVGVIYASSPTVKQGGIQPGNTAADLGEGRRQE